MRKLAQICAIVLAASISCIAQVSAAPIPGFTPAPASPGSVLTNEPYTATACFDNLSPTDTGFQPTIQTVVPAGSALASASFIGNAQTVQTIGTCALVAGCPTGFVNPDTGLTIPLANGETLAIVRSQLGSFPPNQPAACVNLGFTLSDNTTAPIGVTRNMQLTPIFSLGADPLDNPGIDPPIVGAPVSLAVTPAVVRVTKVIVAPESETATGPNYARTFIVTANVANAQTLTDFDLTDVLPNTLQYVSGSATLTGCGGIVTSVATPGATPGGTLTRRCATVTGTTSATDLVLQFQAYVPQNDSGGVAVITSGSPNRLVTNSATGSGSYDPPGPDPVVAVNVNSLPATVTAKLLALRKSAVVVVDTAPAGPSPGDTLEYTLTLDLSDYFSIDTLAGAGFKLQDVLGDGQTFAGCASASYDARMNATVVTAQPFAGASCSVSPKDVPTGQTSVVFDLGAALAPVFGTTINGDLAADAVQSGSTTIAIRFRTTIDTAYAATPFPGPGSPELTLGDSIGNTAAANGVSAGNNVGDNTTATTTIVNATFIKSVYAYNGIVPPPANFRVAAGDTLTYRLTWSLPIASLENAFINDFLPIPFFDATTVTTADVAAANTGTPPPVGSWTTGPADTFTVIGALPNKNKAPVVTTNAVENTVRWTYGDYVGQQPSETIDLLFTVRATQRPIADNLNLANLATSTYQNTQASVTTAASVGNITTRAPKLTIVKQIIASSNAACVAGTVPANYDAARVNCDAGDTVDFRLLISNVGAAPAFNVRVDDDMGLPAAGFGNSCTLLSVTNNSGTAIAASGNLFDLTANGGLTIATIPADANGTLEPTEIARVNYRCTIAQNALPSLPLDQIDNTARLKYFASSATQTTDPLYNYASNQQFPGPNVRKARVTVRTLQAITKVITASSVTQTTNPNINFGETLTFTITTTLSEGTYQNFSLTDTTTVVPSPITCGSGGFTCSANVSVAGTTVTVAGTAGNVPGTVAYTYSLPKTASGTNTAAVSALNAPTLQASAVWTLVAPAATLPKSFNVATADAGDTVQVRLGWPNGNAASPMFQCVITDTLNTTFFDETTVVPVTTPAGYTFSRTGATITYTATNLTTPCTVAALGAVFSVQLKATAPTGGTTTNTASLAANTLPSPQVGGATVTASGTATLSLTAPLLTAKTVIATTEPDTAFTATSASLEVGELVTYRIVFTVPDGVTQALTLVDEMQGGIANLGYVTGSALLSRSSTLLTSATNPGAINAAAANAQVAVIPTCVSPAAPCAANEVRFDLGNVTNASLAVATTETYTLEMRFQVLNVAANTPATARANRGRILYTNANGVAQTLNGGAVTVTVVGPTPTLAKSVAPLPVSSGDSVTYTLTIRNNATGAGAAPAYDWTFRDVLPATLLTPTLVLPLPAGVTASFAGNTLTGTVTRLDPGTQVQLQYTATINPATPIGQTITNAGSTQTTSLPGTNGTGNATTGAAGSTTGERTGTGGINNLTAAATAPFSTNTLNIAKTLLNAQSFYAIGDTANYEVRIAVPKGTATLVNLLDTLPAGMTFVAGSATLSTTGGPVTCSGPILCTAVQTSVTPTVAGQALTFALGTVTATNAGEVVVRYNAVVTNSIANQDGVLLVNNARVTLRNPNTGATTTIVPPSLPSVRVGEPNLTMTKAITAGATNADAGNAVDFAVVTTNTGNTTAYRVNWRDQLPTGLFNISNVVVTTSGGVLLNGTATPVTSAQARVRTTVNTNDTIDLAVVALGDASDTIQMAPGASLTIAFRAVVMDNVTPGQTLTNVARADFTSQLSGACPATCRDGSGGGDDDDNAILNNYNESASATLTIRAGVAIDKQVDRPTAPIGATVLFTNRIDFIEGVTPNVSFTDVLPAGLTYVSHSIAVGHVGMTLGNAGYNTRLGTGQTVGFNLGTVTNPTNASAADDFVTIEITARVDNVSGNQNAVALRNGDQAQASTVSVTYGATPVTVFFDADPVAPGLQGRPVTITEPDLSLTKAGVPSSQALGDIVTYTLTVAHTGTSTADAFNVDLTDVLPAGLTFVAGSVNPPSAFVSQSGQTLNFALNPLTIATGTFAINYQARIDTSAIVGVPLTNTAGVKWRSQDGATGAPTSGRTGGGGVNDYTRSTSASVTPNEAAFIDAQKTVAIAIDVNGDGIANPLDTLEYTITLRNTGSAVTNVVYTDPIPANTTLVSSSTTTTRGTISETPSLVTVNVGGMASNDVVTIRFRVVISAGTPAGTVISNQGSVDSDQTVPEPTDQDGIDGNGDQPTEIIVGGNPSSPGALYAEKLVALNVDNDGSGTITQGDRMRYTIILHNTGGTPITNVAFSDTIPAGLTYAGTSSASAGTLSVAGALVTWSGIGTLAPSGFASATFDVLVSTVTPPAQTYVNQGTATAGGLAPVLTDGNGNPNDGNQPTSFVAVAGGVAAPVMDVQKRWSLAIDTPPLGVPSPGDVLLYTISVTNSGATSATNLHLTDPIPICTGVLNPCTSFVAGSLTTSQGAIVSTAPIDVNLGTLPPGGAASVTFRVQVDAATADGVVIANQALATFTGGTRLSDDNGNPADGLNPTLTPISTSAAGGAPNNLTKQLVGSSEPNTISTGNAAVIGEVMRYRVAVGMPSGTTRQVTLHDTLPDGLAYLPGSARLARLFDTGLVASANPGNVNAAPTGTFVPLVDGGTIAVGAGPGNTTTLAVFLGNVINSDNDANDEQYALEYRAVVGNVAVNQAGSTLTNAATVSFWNALSQTQTLTPVGTTLTVREPGVTVTKSASPSSLLNTGGATTFTLTIANAASATAAPAFDLVLADPLPATFASVGPRTITSVGASGVVDTTSGTVVAASIGQLDPGGSVTITFNATAPGPVAASAIPNTVNATWTSLPGTNGSSADGVATPGLPGTATGERTGTGGVNDYAGSGTATLAIGGVNIGKAIVAAQTRYAIGDRVSYAVDVAVPGAAFGALPNVVVTDVLDAGLTYVPGTLLIAYNGVASTGNPADFTRTDNTPLPGKETLTLPLGTLTNGNAGAATVRLTYQAVVDNVLGNQANTSLANAATIAFTDPSLGNATTTRGPASTGLTVGEPFLALTKALSSSPVGLSAGSTASYSVTVGNTGTTTAFETVLDDALPVGLFFPPASVVTVTANNVSGQLQIPTTTVNAAGWQTSPFDLPVGDTVTFTFTATLAGTVQPAQTLQNTVQGTFTSRDGIDPNERNGSSPGSDQADNTQLNNYNAQALSGTIVVADPVAIDKTFTPNPALTRYAIGQLVSYRLRVALVEGTTRNVRVGDTLPAGMTYVASGPPGIAPGAPITFSYAGNPSIAGQTITFDLGDVVNQPDGNSGNDFIVIDVTARVDNILANQGGTVLGNNAQVQFIDGANANVTRFFDADAATPGVQPLDLTVIEPVVALTKSATPASVSLGDEVTFTLVADHTVASRADAFDVTVVDTLPAGLSFVAGSASLTPTVSGQTLTFNLGALTLAADNTSITYRARVSTNAAVNTPLTNNAAMTYASTPGATGAANSGRNGIGAPLNDYRNVAIATVTPNGNAQIRGDKTVALVVDADASGNLTPGDTIEWTILVTNTGAAVTNVVFTDPLPSDTTYVAGSLVATKGVVFPTLPTLRVDIGPMAQNEAVTIAFRTKVNAGVAAGTLIANQGSVDSDQTVPTLTDNDFDGSNGRNPTTILVNGLPAITVVKTQSFPNDINNDGSVNPGETIRYTLIVRSTGTASASDIVLNDPVPANTTVTIASTTNGTITATSPAVIVNIGTLAPNATATVTIDVLVAASTPTPTTIANQATVSGSGGLPPGTSNLVSVPLLPTAVLLGPAGQKTGGTVGPSTIEWRMVWINNRNARNLIVRVIDPIPANLTYIPATLACSPRGTSVVANCVYDAANGRIVVDATLGQDVGNNDEAAAANELVITFRTSYASTNTTNVAGANWDGNGSGSVTDDIALGQIPVTVSASVTPYVSAIPTTSREALFALAMLLAVVGAMATGKRVERGNL